MKFLQILVLTFLSTPLFAEPAEAPDLASRVERLRIEYRLNADGSHTEDRELAKTVLKERAVAGLSRTSISYSASMQTVDIREAYTRKPDGRRIDVPRNNFQVVENKGKDEDAPIFSDITRMTVVFPEVAVGDTLVLSYKITETEPMFPGKFSVVRTFSRSDAYDDVTIRFDFPVTLQAQYEAREMAEKVTDSGGRRLIEWRYQNKDPIKDERRDYSVYDMESDPGYAFSTFNSYQDIAAAYGARALPKATVTERIRKLADEIAGDKENPREQARVLYEWVATNIRYAGNCIGVGAVVPHDTGFILDNRMGDCKDHATLLQALLAARGIKSTQALINSGSVYKLPRIPVVSTVNHVINYLPELDLYVDSTSETTPFGMLPSGDAGKPVLWVENFKNGTHTPVPNLGENRQAMKSKVKIRQDGSISGSVDVALNGIFAVQMRDLMRHMPKDVENEVVKNAFQSQGLVATGDFKKQDAKALLDTYGYAATFDVTNYINRPGAGAFEIRPFFFSPAPVNAFAQAAVEQTEEVDVACFSGYSVEEFVIEFAEGMKILAVPDNSDFSNSFLSYKATYNLDGQTLTVRREIDDRTQGVTCSPEQQAAYKEFARKMAEDLRSQVVYM